MNINKVSMLTNKIAVLREKLRIAENQGKDVRSLVVRITSLQKQRYEILKSVN